MKQKRNQRKVSSHFSLINEFTKGLGAPLNQRGMGMLKELTRSAKPITARRLRKIVNGK